MKFCSVDLAKWLSSHSRTYFSNRLKKNTCIKIEGQIWQQLQDLGLSPGMLVTLAYSEAIFWGKKIQSQGTSKYVVRPTPPKRKYRQHSQFYLGLQGLSWQDCSHFFCR